MLVRCTFNKRKLSRCVNLLFSFSSCRQSAHWSHNWQGSLSLIANPLIGPLTDCGSPAEHPPHPATLHHQESETTKFMESCARLERQFSSSDLSSIRLHQTACRIPKSWFCLVSGNYAGSRYYGFPSKIMASHQNKQCFSLDDLVIKATIILFFNYTTTLIFILFKLRIKSCYRISKKMKNI